MLDDAHIRRLVLHAIPDIDPHRLEVQEMDYGAAVGWWLRNEQGYRDHGRTIALNRSEADIAKDIASDIATLRCGTKIEEAVEFIIAPLPSPYEGKRGKHPNNCTCSKHKS